eukprot:298286-Chlamydomonas_euryale.AAC.4
MAAVAGRWCWCNTRFWNIGGGGICASDGGICASDGGGALVRRTALEHWWRRHFDVGAARVEQWPQHPYNIKSTPGVVAWKWPHQSCAKHAQE